MQSDAVDPKFEQEYEGRFAWRRDRQIANLAELSGIAQTGGPDAMKALPGLVGSLATDDPKDALQWSILFFWLEAAECYILGQFQSCVLACGAVVERCLKLEYERAEGKLPPGARWTLGKCIRKCKGIVAAQVLDLAKQILGPRNSRAHALLEHTDPQLSIIGGSGRGIEVRSPHHHLVEPYRGDAKKVIEITFGILVTLYGTQNQQPK